MRVYCKSTRISAVSQQKYPPRGKTPLTQMFRKFPHLDRSAAKAMDKEARRLAMTKHKFLAIER